MFVNEWYKLPVTIRTYIASIFMKPGPVTPYHLTHLVVWYYTRPILSVVNGVILGGPELEPTQYETSARQPDVLWSKEHRGRSRHSAF